MTAIAIFGASGRMGQALVRAIQEVEEAELAGGGGRGDDPEALAARADLLIDFSSPDALSAHLAAAVAKRVPMVIGTTGLTQNHLVAIQEASRAIPLLRSANMSLGVNLLAHLLESAAARLGPEWDIEIVEMHHRDKLDAPSGTALLLGQAASSGRGVELADVSARGRDGVGPRRRRGDIGFASLRGGSVPGDHLIILAGDGERIELGHRAETRDIFARGAIRAGLWLKGQPAGLYDMKDVLGL